MHMQIDMTILILARLLLYIADKRFLACGEIFACEVRFKYVNHAGCIPLQSSTLL